MPLHSPAAHDRYNVQHSSPIDPLSRPPATPPLGHQPVAQVHTDKRPVRNGLPAAGQVVVQRTSVRMRTRWPSTSRRAEWPAGGDPLGAHRHVRRLRLQPGARHCLRRHQLPVSLPQSALPGRLPLSAARQRCRLLLPGGRSSPGLRGAAAAHQCQRAPRHARVGGRDVHQEAISSRGGRALVAPIVRTDTQRQ